MTTRMKAPENWSGGIVIEGGKEYVPDADGIIEVDNEAHIPVLVQHGYVQDAGPVSSKKAPKPADDDDDVDDEFDSMTKAELIDWLEERDVEVPNKPKRGQLQQLARDHKAKGDDE